MIDPMLAADVALQLDSYWESIRDSKRPTNKQIVVLRDRNMQVPVTRRAASRLIATIAQVEGWDSQ